MYKYYNPNPYGKVVGDCVVRGISKLTNKSWDYTFLAICMTGFDVKNMPSGNEVWEVYLSNLGYTRTMLPDTCPYCYTVNDFTNDYPKGEYLLTTGTHVVAVEDGDYYDAWDSGNEVPIYYWRKEQTNGL